MGLSYTHLLIPADDHFHPTGEMIVDFLEGTIELGVIPDAKIGFSPVNRVEARTHRGRNPFTGEIIVFHEPTRLPGKLESLENAKQIGPAAKGVQEFNVRAYGIGLPITPPLEIDFSKPYSITVTACVRSRPVSLSDLHEESKSNRERMRFGEDCEKPVASGLFTHPTTLEIIEVPRAGCANFWIEFELGKFLFPKISGNNLRILNPQITKRAEQSFNVEFVQGCNWG